MAIVVPGDKNEVDIGGLTDAKLRAGDYSGSGLEALGAGLAGLGKAGAAFAASLPRPDEAQQHEAQLLRNDLAAKQAWNDGHEANKTLLDDFRQLKGKNARDALAPTAEAMANNFQAVRQGLSNDHQRAIIDGTLARRTLEDIADLHAHADQQDALAQDQESQRLIANSASDAMSHVGDPARFDDAIATGEHTVRQRGKLAGKSEADIGRDVADWQSARYVDAVHALTSQDGLGAAALYGRYRDSIAPADQARLEPLLVDPLAQAQAIADVDTPALAAAPSAPPTPRGDPMLLDRMRVITPGIDRTVLPEMMRRYGGDAARTWAATQLGPDEVDALIKQHGDGWYRALPEDTRQTVAHNMALLAAPTSARTAPVDPAATTASFAGLDETRRALAQRELDYRGYRADQARGAAEKTATDQAFDLAEKLGPEFTSIAQIPAKTRLDLPAHITDVLRRQADANIHPTPVAPEGAVSLALRDMASTRPEAFGKLDMREYRDLIAPEEYAMFQRVQRSWRPDGPGVGEAAGTEPSSVSLEQPHGASPGNGPETLQRAPDSDARLMPHDLLDPTTLAALQATADIEARRDDPAEQSPGQPSNEPTSIDQGGGQPAIHDLLSSQLVAALEATAARETRANPRTAVPSSRQRFPAGTSPRPHAATTPTPHAPAPFAQSLQQLARTIARGAAPADRSAPGLFDRLDERASTAVDERLAAIQKSLSFDYDWISRPRQSFDVARRTFAQLWQQGKTPVSADYVQGHPAEFPGRVLTRSYGSNIDKGVVDAGQFSTDQISGDYVTVGLDATHRRLPKIPGASTLQAIVREMSKNSVVSMGQYQDIQSFGGHALTGSGDMNGVYTTRSYSLNGPHMSYSGLSAGVGIPNLKNLPHGTVQKTYTFLFNIKRK